MAKETLEQVIAEEREEAAILRKHKQTAIADAIDRVLDRVAASTEYFRTYVPENDAILRSNHRRPWWRSRFAQWERQGLARHSPTNKRERQYLLCIVPVAMNLDAVRADARRAAAGESERKSA